MTRSTCGPCVRRMPRRTRSWSAYPGLSQPNRSRSGFARTTLSKRRLTGRRGRPSPHGPHSAGPTGFRLKAPGRASRPQGRLAFTFVPRWFIVFSKEGPVKRFILSIWLVIILVLASSAAFAQEDQKACEFNIVGTWQSTSGGHANPTLLRFSRNGTCTVLSRNGSGQGPEWQATHSSRFKLDKPKTPKAIPPSP